MSINPLDLKAFLKQTILAKPSRNHLVTWLAANGNPGGANRQDLLSHSEL